ncbi:alpha-amylase family glycosyl hydrolase [Ideonella paludis]|uniref:Alpha-amylase n=1 Tax=Ideonella paludis TaxID=1233411 RepID=A0ABS5DRR6_9BURK|nr:alpha-amylase family glycosyl hydrolase [Ideonella paludis]MBQ0933830.1 alpha-amylase [Ideonella paludis]
MQRRTFNTLLAASAASPYLLHPMTASAAPTADMPHLPWTRQANIYEVNIRQYTPEGTLGAFQAHLPRLQKMGVDILWLMPIQPIGRQERKGSLGSYYSIADYTAVNPEFGGLADVKALVQDAHARGMKVILDWVANHTAWDHPWTSQHKDWYKLNAQGEIFPVTFNEGTPQVEYWSDVVALNYDSAALREAMIGEMAFWVRECDLDGFRCDVAGLVPTAFWNEARRRLDAIKPMFMLAEWSEPELHEQAFDMSYGWDLQDVFKAIGSGKAGADALRAWVRQPTAKPFPAHAYRMRFTSNHDINSWHGTDAELYGPAYGAFAVLSFTLPGMPLIYGGQEGQLDRRLAFFEKDTITWAGFPRQAFYSELIALKKAHPALANGQYGAPVSLLDAGNPQVFAFKRQQNADWVQVVVNVSATPQRYHLQGQEAEIGPWQWAITAAPAAA